MDLMFGESAKSLTITFSENYQPVLLAILPPGAFIALGLFIAVKNYIEIRRSDKKQNNLGIQVDVQSAQAIK